MTPKRRRPSREKGVRNAADEKPGHLNGDRQLNSDSAAGQQPDTEMVIGHSNGDQGL